MPVRLRDDAYAIALALEHPSNDGHTKAGMINIGVSRYHDNVAAVPAQQIHLFPRRG